MSKIGPLISEKGPFWGCGEFYTIYIYINIIIERLLELVLRHFNPEIFMFDLTNRLQFARQSTIVIVTTAIRYKTYNYMFTKIF